LSAVDDQPVSASGTRHPMFNLLRLRHDVGAQSTVGMTFTDRTENGSSYNRVASADARIVFAKLYFVQFQTAGSFTEEGNGIVKGALWEAVADRTGRRWGFHYSVLGIHPDFRTQSGFVPRTGIVSPRIFNRITTYGAPGAFLENWTTFIGVNGTWKYHSFFDARAPLETSASANSFVTLRGGWSVTVTPSWNTTSFDPDFYAGYAVERHGARVDTVAFVVPDRLNVLALALGATTPQFPKFSASVSATLGHAPAFFEPSRVNQFGASSSVLWRPTKRARVEGSYTHLALMREADGSRFSTANIPRLKLEYQLSRPLFVRFIGQYQSQERAALRDPLTGDPILVRDPATQVYVLGAATSVNTLRTDWLISYRPSPGTVVFAGYGSGFIGTEGYSLRGLDRSEDGLFFKVSYLFRL